MLRKIWEIFVGCFRQVDLVLLALCTGTTLFGCLMIASATHYTGSYKNVVVQLAALCLGIVAYVLMSMLDLAEISKYWKWLLGGSLVLILLLKTPLGMESGGNRAWLGVEGIPVSLQPAEIVKITFILLLARQLVYLQENRDLKSVPSIAMLGGHLILIVGAYAAVSGDMGSALVFVFVFACMCFVAGVAKRWFVIGILGGSFAFYVLWETDKINPYMKERFMTLFDHDLDTMGVGWQQTRSLLALGGGKLTGQGLFHGTQTPGSYTHLQHAVVHKPRLKGGLHQGDGHIVGTHALFGRSGEIHQHHLGDVYKRQRETPCRPEWSGWCRWGSSTSGSAADTPPCAACWG